MHQMVDLYLLWNLVFLVQMWKRRAKFTRNELIGMDFYVGSIISWV